MHFTKLKMLNGIPAIQIIILQENWIALKKIGTSGILGWKVKCLLYDYCMLLLCTMNGQTYVQEKVDLFLKLPLQWTWAWCMQPFFGSYVTLVNVHCIVASFLPIYLHLSQKCLFLFKMPIQPLRLVLQQKQPHQQLHLNKVSFKLLKGYVSERLRLVQKKILYGSTSFVSFKYTPKLWPELQCSVYWLLSDLCHQLDLKNKPRKSVPSSEWRGGESTEDFVEVDTILCLKCGYLSKIFLGWTIMTNQSNTKH